MISRNKRILAILERIWDSEEAKKELADIIDEAICGYEELIETQGFEYWVETLYRIYHSATVSPISREQKLRTLRSVLSCTDTILK